MLASLGIGFLLGALSILAAQAYLVYYFFLHKSHLKSKTLRRTQTLDSPKTTIPLPQSKKGVVWVLEPEKVPKTWQEASREQQQQKRKKEFYEVSPVKKHAQLKSQLLLLKESDGSQAAVLLKSCAVEAVSSTSLASRKWAKRFPIKLESKDFMLYKGSKIIYIYLETSWEKESWCKALRLAACDEKEKLEDFAKLWEQFQCYLTLLNGGYPSFMKHSGAGPATEPADKANKDDGSPSKVRLFLRKLSKSHSKASPDNNKPKVSNPSPQVMRSQSFTEGRTIPAILPPSTLIHCGSQIHTSVASDAGSDEKAGSDEATLCLNLLLSRLFFDAKSNVEIKKSMQALIQRTLSNMRTPSYVGDVICTGLNIGNLPPYIHGMRAVPVDMGDVWALEVDIGYYGGAVLDIETRLEVCELDFPEGTGDAGSVTSSTRDMSSDLFEEFEYLEKQLNLVEGADDAVDYKEECDRISDGSNISRSSVSSNGSRWKSLLNKIAKQVSQVPLTLAIRITSLRGTLRLRIKPPPSDRLWFGFTSMPDIDFNLDSSVGDHKITSGRIALYLINRFKTTIRETLVLPNFENVCIPWMLADKDDWVPRKTAPFIWVNQEPTNDSPTIICEASTEEKHETESGGETSGDHSQAKDPKLIQADSVEKTRHDPKKSLALSVESTGHSGGSSSSVTSRELRAPLLLKAEPQETRKNKLDDTAENGSPSGSVILFDKQSSVRSEDDELKSKKVGRRARMFDMGKKMGEKLEEKRRSIEEKSRNVVEKMRGPRNSFN